MPRLVTWDCLPVQPWGSVILIYAYIVILIWICREYSDYGALYQSQRDLLTALAAHALAAADSNCTSPAVGLVQEVSPRRTESAMLMLRRTRPDSRRDGNLQSQPLIDQKQGHMGLK